MSRWKTPRCVLLAASILVTAGGSASAIDLELLLTTPSSKPIGSVTIQVDYEADKLMPKLLDPKRPELGFDVRAAHPSSDPGSTLVVAAPAGNGSASLMVLALSGTAEGFQPTAGPEDEPLRLLRLAFDQTGAEAGVISATIERVGDRFGNTLEVKPGVAIPEPTSFLAQAAALMAVFGLAATRRAC